MIERGKYMVYFVHPDNSKLYLFEHDKSATSLTGLKMLTITMPTAYSSDAYRLGYVDGHVGIISLKVGQWWATSIKIDTASKIWSKTQVFESAAKDCSSCSISGYDDFYVIGGIISANPQIMIVDKSTGAPLLRVVFDGASHISLSSLRWTLDSIYATRTTSGGWKMGTIMMS